ncbi:hypothetical protein [Aeromicrobium fastidiosum]|uniref:Uncharacterized protein n=1 Tax=Aeromicrobium fastidiosum TaxID=52699 RepID=A0A641AM26_9ACTN|nr:hypothetical protein [Aeromicrobium fastidiosum]KAA1376453.1 hypothetical protein ESP62_013585 [Aeromicrobium fastidiosum]MBP2391632.1 putative membrane protein [Aeromicrobium fastidiosum]
MAPQQTLNRIHEPHRRVRLGPAALRELCDAMAFEQPYRDDLPMIHIAGDDWTAGNADDLLAIPLVSLKSLKLASARSGLALTITGTMAVLQTPAAGTATAASEVAAEKVRRILGANRCASAAPFRTIAAIMLGYLAAVGLLIVGLAVCSAAIPVSSMLGILTTGMLSTVVLMRHLSAPLPPPDAVILDEDAWATRPFFTKCGLELMLVAAAISIIVATISPFRGS